MKEMRAISKETGKTYVMKMKDGSNFNYGREHVHHRCKPSALE
jgi:hypothetical protein